MGEKRLLEIHSREAPGTASAWGGFYSLVEGARGKRNWCCFFRRVFNLLTSLSFPEKRTVRLREPAQDPCFNNSPLNGCLRIKYGARCCDTSPSALCFCFLALNFSSTYFLYHFFRQSKILVLTTSFSYYFHN